MILPCRRTDAWRTSPLQASHSLSVLNLATRQQEIEIPVGNEPHFLALSPDGSTAYVANRGDNTISMIDLAARLEIATIPTGAEPVDVALTTSFDPGLSQRRQHTRPGWNLIEDTPLPIT